MFENPPGCRFLPGSVNPSLGGDVFPLVLSRFLWHSEAQEQATADARMTNAIRPLERKHMGYIEFEPVTGIFSVDQPLLTQPLGEGYRCVEKHKSRYCFPSRGDGFQKKPLPPPRGDNSVYYDSSIRSTPFRRITFEVALSRSPPSFLTMRSSLPCPHPKTENIRQSDRRLSRGILVTRDRFHPGK